MHNLLKPFESNKWCTILWWFMVFDLLFLCMALALLCIRIVHHGSCRTVDLMLIDHIVMLGATFVIAKLQYSICRAALK